MATVVVLGMAGLTLVVDFLGWPDHLDRYGPRKARRRASDSM